MGLCTKAHKKTQVIIINPDKSLISYYEIYVIHSASELV